MLRNHKRRLGLDVIIGAFVAAACLLPAACRPRATEESVTTKSSVTPALFATGQRLYAKQCAACHGPQGRGDGVAAYLLYPKPRDFTQNEFRLVSTTTMR